MSRRINKQSLSHEHILAVAISFADKQGIESLSMRKLAALMRTGAMSIYHYFANKDELLDAMLDSVAGEIHLPKQGEKWRDALTQLSISAHQTLLKHRWANAIWSKRRLGPNKLAYMESILRVLREGGFSVALACDAYHAITIHIEGFTLHADGFPVKADEVQSIAAQFLESVEDPDSIPFFIEHVEHHLNQTTGCSDQFEKMLNILLDSFESQLLENPPT